MINLSTLRRFAGAALAAVVVLATLAIFPAAVSAELRETTDAPALRLSARAGSEAPRFVESVVRAIDMLWTSVSVYAGSGSEGSWFW